MKQPLGLGNDSMFRLASQYLADYLISLLEGWLVSEGGTTPLSRQMCPRSVARPSEQSIMAWTPGA